MHKVPKGRYGYISYERKVQTLVTILLVGGAAAVYAAALLWLGTNQNYFTIAAVLLLLPGARYLVNMVMFFRARGCSPSVYEGVEAHIGSLAGAYDLYMTAEKSNYAISHLALCGKTIAALTEDPKCDVPAGETHIRCMLQQNGFHGYTVKIFTEPEKYYARLASLNRLQGESGAGDRQEEVLSLMKAISL